MKENTGKSLSAYWKMKKEWGREIYTFCCKLNNRNTIAWFRLGIMKLRGLRKGVEREKSFM
jgi:hypothetical protein